MDLASVNFPVRKVKLQTETGQTVPDRMAVVREDTGKVIGLVSERYQIITNDQLLRSVGQVSQDLGLTPTTVTSCRGGSRMFARFLRDAGDPGVEVQVGDVVKVGVEVFNSYDGSMPLGVMLIAQRLKCLNGMVVPETLTTFRQKHYPDLSLSDVRGHLAEALSHVERTADKWREWTRTPVRDEQVQSFLGEAFGPRTKSRLFMRYLAEREDATLWGAYNFLTRHFTHELHPRKGRVEDLRLMQWSIETPVTERFYQYAWN